MKHPSINKEYHPAHEINTFDSHLLHQLLSQHFQDMQKTWIGLIWIEGGNALKSMDEIRVEIF